ncbi:MAG: DsrE/DsrF/DrsH-like family protein [Polyangiaceae bacterium]
MTSNPQSTTIDCRGMQCPAPILATAKAAKGLRATGGILQVLADDAAFPLDVKSWCRSAGATMLEIEEGSDGFRATIKIAGEAPTVPAPSRSDTTLLDCLGQQCPKPILALAKHARQAEPGSELEVVADDAAFPADLRSWCRSAGAEILSFDDQSTPFRARLRLKGRVATQPLLGGGPGHAPPPPARPVAPAVQPAAVAAIAPVSAVPATPVADHIRIDVSWFAPDERTREMVRAARDARATQLTVVAPDPTFNSVLLGWCAAEGHTLRSLNGSGPVIAEIGLDVHRLGTSLGQAVTALAPIAPAQAEPQVTALAAPGANNCALLVMHNDHEALLAALLIANGAAASGMDVTMFFTFWGLNLLRGDRPNPNAPKEKVSFIQRMFKWMMPKGPKRQALGQMNFGGVGRGMLDSIMKGQNLMLLPDLLESAQSQGVKFIACTMSMSVMGITKRDLHPYDHLEYGGVAAFVDAARGAGLHMVF